MKYCSIQKKLLTIAVFSVLILAFIMGIISILMIYTLSNKIMVYAYFLSEEIVSIRERCIYASILLDFLICVVMVIVIRCKITHIIDPLKKLAEIDVLTGLDNRTSYQECVAAIELNENHEYDFFAIVVLDLNYLKLANDCLGHEVGDILLIEAGNYIRSIFTNSQIFRIGGDEFVVILGGENYKNRKELLHRFEQNMDYEVAGAERMHLSIAFGMADYPIEGADYCELFTLADNRMYAKKREMKNGLNKSVGDCYRDIIPVRKKNRETE